MTGRMVNSPADYVNPQQIWAKAAQNKKHLQRARALWPKSSVCMIDVHTSFILFEDRPSGLLTC
jgi:hypothetical protein